jgi:alkylation response protein AidB-like acyl-CoA dehydrogenase
VPAASMPAAPDGTRMSLGALWTLGARPQVPYPLSDEFWSLYDRVVAFMRDRVLPNEAVYHAQVGDAPSGPPEAVMASPRWTTVPPIIESLKAEARAQGLWNLWITRDMADAIRADLPAADLPYLGPGLSHVEYAVIAEATGHSPHIGPECFNCSAPDTGNMELLAKFASLVRVYCFFFFFFFFFPPSFTNRFLQRHRSKSASGSSRSSTGVSGRVLR